MKYSVKVLLLVLGVFLSCAIFSMIYYFDFVNKYILGKDKYEVAMRDFFMRSSRLYLEIDGYSIDVDVARNSTTEALVKELLKNDISISMEDYEGAGRIGFIGAYLPYDSEEQIDHFYAGSIFLESDNLIIFYDDYDYNIFDENLNDSQIVEKSYMTIVGYVTDISKEGLNYIFNKDKNSIKVTLRLPDEFTSAS